MNEHTFTPTYESDDVSISEQTYAEDSHRHGDIFLSVSSGGLTVNFDELSVDWKDDGPMTVWFYDNGSVSQSMFVDESDARQIAEKFEN